MVFNQVNPPEEQDKNKIKGIVLFVIISMIIIFIFIYFFQPYGTDNIIIELKKLSPDMETIKAIEDSQCKKLEKNDKYWIFSDCQDDVYFKAFIKPNGEYYLGYCTSWETQREAFKKLGHVLTLGPNKCIDETLEDEYVYIEYYEEYGVKTYNVCGVRVYFRDECIIGTGYI